MSGEIVVRGMVLQTAPAGETDVRLVLLTENLGKITAFARGARKMGSRLLAPSSPFAFGTFHLYAGRNSYTLVGADISQYFEKLKEDLTGVLYGSFFLEFASYYAQEGMDGSEMLNLLYISLLALQKEALSDRLVRVVYEIRLMVINGEYPQDLKDDQSLLPGTRAAIAYAISAPLRRLFSFTVNDEVLEELERVQKRTRERFVDRNFSSLRVLNTIAG